MERYQKFMPMLNVGKYPSPMDPMGIATRRKHENYRTGGFCKHRQIAIHKEKLESRTNI